MHKGKSHKVKNNRERKSEKEIAIDACRLLNMFIGSLIAGAKSIEIFERLLNDNTIKTTIRISATTQGALFYMCVSHIIITIYKIREVLIAYEKIFPEEFKSKIDSFLAEVEKRRIKDFRDQYVAHIHARDRSGPLKSSEVLKHYYDAFQGGDFEFLLWINDLRSADSVVRIIEDLQNATMKKYVLTENDLKEISLGI